MSTFMEHIHREADTVPLAPGAPTRRSADLMHDHLATEVCPVCGPEGVDTSTT